MAASHFNISLRATKTSLMRSSDTILHILPHTQTRCEMGNEFLLFYNCGQEAEFSRNVERKREGGENRKQVQKLYVNADGVGDCVDSDNGGGVFSVPRIMEEREPANRVHLINDKRDAPSRHMINQRGQIEIIFGLRTLLLRRLLPLSVQVLAVLSPTAAEKSPNRAKSR